MSAATATRCPLCGANAYPWITAPRPGGRASVGLPSPVDPEAPGSSPEVRLFDRCEQCGAGIERGEEPVDLERELDALTVRASPARRDVEAPNRASWQAGIGGDGWAALADVDGRLLLTKQALRLLAERNGLELEGAGSPPWGANQRWLWQTMLNGITLHPNFLTRVRRGELRPESARSRFAYAADLVASVLAAPLVALISLPVEALAALLGRGGRIAARLRAPGARPA